MPLKTKGENDFDNLGVAIKSKGGYCWHYDTCWRYGTGVAQVLSLMATHSGDRSQLDLSSSSQNEGKDIYAGSPRRRHVYTWVIHYKGAYVYTRTFTQGKARTYWRTYFWSVVFSPW